MNLRQKKIRIGIIGCGAIGSRIAQSVIRELKKNCLLSALYDIDPKKTQQLAKHLHCPKTVQSSYQDLLKTCDFVVEAVAAKDTRLIIRQAIETKKNVLAMSVGHLLNAAGLFRLAERRKCQILIPSGAIAGLDAIRAASLTQIDKVTLTTRKPPGGFTDSPYILEKGINIDAIERETVLYEGDVENAVRFFPKNINVAATLALASGARDKMSIRIITSPAFKTNSHEIEMTGDFGRIVTLTDNVVCPDNPKTSYLAVLSAIQTLKQFLNGVKIGT